MKRKILLVSALVVVAMGAMFVSCRGGIKGCTCKLTYSDGSTDTEYISRAEMNEYGYVYCGDLVREFSGNGYKHISCY